MLVTPYAGRRHRLPQNIAEVGQQYGVRACISVGSGYHFELVRKAPVTVNPSFSKVAGKLGMRSAQKTGSYGISAPSRVVNGEAISFLVAGQAVAGQGKYGITSAIDGYGVPRIYCTNGALEARATVAGNTNVTITGPTIAYDSDFVGIVRWRPGVGIAASFNGGAVQTSANGQTSLYVAPNLLWFGSSTATRCYLVASFGDLSDEALRHLSANPAAIFAAATRRIWIPDASGGSADLVLQSAAHAHNADALALSSAHALIASASAHAHAAANLDLSSAMGLSVSPAAHAHTADAPTLSAALFLLIQNTLHAHAAGNVTLDNTGAAVLAIADALHAHTANPLAISQAVTLAVASALHPHTADAPTLQTLVSLMIAHAQHGHAADNIAFGIAVIELVQDLMLDALYQAGDFGLAVDCLLGTAAFTAFLDTADDDYFAAQSTGHTLRYRLGVPLQTGDQVTIDGTLYRVNGAPRQINSGEMRAALVRVPS